MLPFTVDRKTEGATIRISVRGELDLATGPRLDEELRRAAAEAPAKVVLDLREVTFFDSTGLQLVLDADVRAREDGREFAVIPGEGEPRRILELADALDRLRVEDAGGGAA
jgi:anti-sigma B factor antagonist